MFRIVAATCNTSAAPEVIANSAPDGSRGAAGSRPAYDPRRHWMLLLRHLREDDLGDVVVAAPVGCAFGIAELVEIVTARLGGEPMREVIDRPRIVDGGDLAAVEEDRIEPGRCGAGRHHGNEAQPKHLGVYSWCSAFAENRWGC